MIYIDCHNGRDQEIIYPFQGWDKAKQDFETLEREMNRCQRALAELTPIQIPDAKVNSDSDSESDTDSKSGSKKKK